MKREDFIKECKFYKGEAVCPKGKPGDLWEYERIWVDLISDVEKNQNRWDSMMNDYRRAGLFEWNGCADVPLTLKVFLFNRYSSWVSIVSAEEFKSWVKKYFS